MHDISVVIPAYRAEEFILRTIRSLLSEGILAKNIIVVEDGIFDDTASIIGNFRELKLFQKKLNSGAPRARNIGLNEVLTEYVMFLDADDFCEGGLLSSLRDSMNLTGSDIAIGPWAYDGENRLRGKVRIPSECSNVERLLRWLHNECFPTSCILWRTASIKRINGWDENLKRNQDGELIVRALSSGLKVSTTSKGLGIYWQHNSPFRVSRSSILDLLVSYEIVDLSIKKNLIDQNIMSDIQLYEYGRHCCRVAWEAYAENLYDVGLKWVLKARHLGYDSPGYNFLTCFLSYKISVSKAAKIKKFLRKFYIYFSKL